MGMPSTSKSNGAPRFSSVKELNEQAEQRLQDSYKFNKFKIQQEMAIKKIEENYHEYRRSPEKHPDYSEEWKNFWQRKYNELLAEGKNANSYDYKPEWVEFWMPRMQELKKKVSAKVKTS